ncbi:MAG: LysM peptidoglycan-binding domain-containing protein [Bacteroidetes bacterium]|nr:LysM peptidoglycan-binding domain-containing protein [Bacteroidota bacterium]
MGINTLERVAPPPGVGAGASISLKSLLSASAVVALVLEAADIFRQWQHAHLMKTQATNLARINQLNNQIKQLETKQKVVSNNLINQLNSASKVLNSKAANTALQKLALQNIIPNNSLQLPKIGDTASYTVKKGDNLSSIAQKYGTSWKTLWELNQTTLQSGNASRIYPGEVIQLPSNAQRDVRSTSVVNEMTMYQWNKDNTNNIVIEPINSANQSINPVTIFEKGMRSVIDRNGDLKQSTIEFLSEALKYDKKILKESNWGSLNESVFLKSISIWKKLAAITAIEYREMEAITLDKNIVFDNSLYSESFSVIESISLVAHEQSHVNDYENLGIFEFLINYIVENKVYGGYGNETTEMIAYKRGNSIRDWLISNPKFANTLENKNILEKEKFKIGKIEGVKYWKEIGIQNEMSIFEELKNRIISIQNIAKFNISNSDINVNSRIYNTMKTHNNNIINEGDINIKKIEEKILKLKKEYEDINR